MAAGFANNPQARVETLLAYARQDADQELLAPFWAVFDQDLTQTTKLLTKVENNSGGVAAALRIGREVLAYMMERPDMYESGAAEKLTENMLTLMVYLPLNKEYDRVLGEMAAFVAENVGVQNLLWQDEAPQNNNRGSRMLYFASFRPTEMLRAVATISTGSRHLENHDLYLVMSKVLGRIRDGVEPTESIGYLSELWEKLPYNHKNAAFLFDEIAVPLFYEDVVGEVDYQRAWRALAGWFAKMPEELQRQFWNEPGEFRHYDAVFRDYQVESRPRWFSAFTMLFQATQINFYDRDHIKMRFYQGLPIGFSLGRDKVLDIVSQIEELQPYSPREDGKLGDYLQPALAAGLMYMMSAADPEILVLKKQDKPIFVDLLAMVPDGEKIWYKEMDQEFVVRHVFGKMVNDYELRIVQGMNGADAAEIRKRWLRVLMDTGRSDWVLAAAFYLESGEETAMHDSAFRETLDECRERLPLVVEEIRATGKAEEFADLMAKSERGLKMGKVKISPNEKVYGEEPTNKIIGLSAEMVQAWREWRSYALTQVLVNSKIDTRVKSAIFEPYEYTERVLTLDQMRQVLQANTDHKARFARRSEATYFRGLVEARRPNDMWSAVNEHIVQNQDVILNDVVSRYRPVKFDALPEDMQTWVVMKLKRWLILNYRRYQKASAKGEVGRVTRTRDTMGLAEWMRGQEEHYSDLYQLAEGILRKDWQEGLVNRLKKELADKPELLAALKWEE